MNKTARAVEEARQRRLKKASKEELLREIEELNRALDSSNTSIWVLFVLAIIVGIATSLIC